LQAEKLEYLLHKLRQEREKPLSDESEVIETGHALWLIVKEATEMLEPLKEELREAARKKSTKPGPVHLKSRNGTRCTVVIPQPQITLKKEADMGRAKRALGSRFGIYFEQHTHTTPQKDFTEVARANPKEARAALAVVDLVEGKPRVTFPEK